jgi:hypothetical protein
MNEAQTLKYAFQFGNENGANSETDKFKGYRFATRYEANPGFTVEGMVAQFERDKNADRTTAQVFAFVERRAVSASIRSNAGAWNAARGGGWIDPVGFGGE